MKRRRGSKGEPSPGVPPLFFCACACAPIRWEVVDGLSCDSTPFLWCLPKETVSSRQRKALFYCGGSTIRVSAPASVVVTHLRPTWGGAWWVSGDWCGCADTLGGGRCPSLPFDPISLVLAQRNGVEPPKKSALKPPRHLGGPTRLSHLGVSPNGTDWCVKLTCGWLDNWPGKVSLTQSAVMLGLRVRGRGGRDRTATVAAPISAFLWGSTPFLCARAKKWGGIGSREERLPPKKTAPPHPPPTSTSPLQKSGEERPDYRLVALTRMVEPPG